MDAELVAFMKKRELAEKGIDPNNIQIGGKGTNTANRAIKPEGTRRCPICEQLMRSEVEFGIAIDVCDAHGVWLDHGELEALADLRTQITRDVLKRHLEQMPRRKETPWPLLIIDSLLSSRRNEIY